MLCVIIYSLRWYILGKHSNIIFTENTNTQCSMEDKLLGENDCFTAQILLSSFNDSSIHANNEANIEGNVITVPESDFQLLKQFEIDTENCEKPVFNDIEEGCAQYVAGYVANRYSNKYPYLSKINCNDTNNWTTYISKGHLTIPSENLFKAVLQIEREFKILHGESLSKSPYVFKTLYEITKPKIEKLNVPDEVLHCLIRTRTYIRLNNLNKQLITKQQKQSDKLKKIKFTN